MFMDACPDLHPIGALFAWKRTTGLDNLTFWIFEKGPMRHLMAARVNKIRHDEETRAKIKTSQLVNRLYAHAVGEVQLEPTQVKAIEILLRKTMPDLSAIDATLSGEVTNYVLSDKPMSDDEWETAYGVESTAGASKSAH
jgi:hypothetical protein